MFNKMEYLKNSIVWMFSLIVTILLLLILDYILVIGMNSKYLLNEVSSIFTYSVDHFQPEPVERMQYISNVICLPFILIFLLFMFNKVVNRFSEKTINVMYTVLSSITLVCICFLFWIGSVKTDFFFFSNSVLYNNAVLLIISIILLILVSNLYTKENIYFVKSVSRILDMTVFLYIVFLGAMNVFAINSVGDQQLYINHFNAVFHSVTMTYLNKFPLVSYVNQYGLYPQFLEPLFKIIGLSVLKFTIVMSLLLIGSFVLMYISMKKILNRYFAFFGFATFLYYGYIFIKSVSSDPYYQYYPIRTLFPSIIIFFAVNYFIKKSNYKYYSSFVITSIAVLWNLDTGAIVFIAWLITLIFSETLQEKSVKKILISCGRHVLVSIITLMLIVVIYSLYIYIRAGSFPNFLLFFQYQKYFFGYGFFMLPMPFIHPWNMIILVYIAGLMFSLYAIFRKDNSIKTIMIFMFSVLGLGLFSYYQGRSHNFVLPYAWYPAFLLIPIFAENLYMFIKQKTISIKHKIPVIILFSLCIAFMFFSLMNIISSTQILYSIVKSRWETTVTVKNTPLLSDIEFIKSKTTVKEESLIISYNSGIEYVMSKTIPAFDSPGLTEMLLIKDYDNLIAFINSRKMEKIFLAKNVSDINGGYNSRLLNSVFSNYIQVDVSKDQSMFMFERKPDTDNTIGVLENEKNKLIHKEGSLHLTKLNEMFYHNKETGIISSNIDIGTMHFNQIFSIQLIVKPEKIQRPLADILGNHPGRGFDGFVIQQDSDLHNLYNFIYGNGMQWSEPIPFNLESDEISYLTIQYEKGNVNVHLNEKKIFSSNMNIEYRNSEMALTLGNWFQGDRLFNGTIDEVQISNSLVSEEDINTNWEYILENVSKK